MLMTALTVLFVGSFVALAGFGHVLVFSAIVFGRPARETAIDQSGLTIEPAHAAR